MTTLSDILIPNLVIAGAPKCGTSSLYNWLNDHPEICGSSPKETFFLMDEDHPLLNKNNNIHKNGLEGYSLFFREDTEKPAILFEATTHYLYQKTAQHILSTLASKPVIFFLLRNPSNRIYSSFEYTKNNLAGFKYDISFPDYVQILLNGHSDMLDTYIDRNPSLYVLKRDLLFSKYNLFLEEWKTKMGSANVYIFLLEELVRSPKTILQRISNILGIDNSFYESYDFPVKNETVSIKSKRLHKIAKKYASIIPSVAIKKIIKSKYLKIQAKSKNQDQNDMRGLQLLDEYFAPYNDKLSSNFNIDISLWRNQNVKV